MTILAVFIALQLSWAWAYRGGSLPFSVPFPFNKRPVELLSTPLFIAVSLALVITPASPWDYAWLAAGVAAFMGAESVGWGRQMDLGKNDKPDNEWGWQIRDLFFKEKSSFRRDLTGLFMRMSIFMIVTPFWWQFSPLAAIAIPVSLFLGGPAIWVAEDVFWWRKNPNVGPPFAIVEYGIGIMLSVVTVAIILASYVSTY